MSEHESPGQRARRLLEGATPGPWHVSADGEVQAPAVTCWCCDAAERFEGAICERCGSIADGRGGIEAYRVVAVEARANDAAFILGMHDLARDLIAAEERVAALEAVVGRVRPVVEALVALADAPERGKSTLAPLMTGLGRTFTTHGDDAAWLRSLLQTAPAPAPAPAHESAPDLAKREAAPASERFTIAGPWRFE